MRRVLLICILGFLVACGGGEQPDRTEAFIGGTEALTLGLVEGSPPETVLDKGQSEFSVSLVLENVGEADVGNGTENPFVGARLTGLNMNNPSQFNLERDDLFKRVDSRLRGARKNFDGTVLPGELTSVTFDNMSYRYGVVGSATYRLQAEACYDYATHANVKICLKRNSYDQAEDASLCDVRADLRPRNSGGPLQVVKANQDPIGRNRIRVRFSMRNLGNGYFYSRAAEKVSTACGKKRGQHRGKAFVVVEPASSDAYRMRCERLRGERDGFPEVSVPEDSQYGIVNFRPGEPSSIACTFTRTGATDQRVIQDLVNVHMYYRYKEAIDVPIVVQETTGRTAPSSSDGGEDGSGGPDDDPPDDGRDERPRQQ